MAKLELLDTLFKIHTLISLSYKSQLKHLNQQIFKNILSLLSALKSDFKYNVFI